MDGTAHPAMEGVLAGSELLTGMDGAHRDRLLAIVERRTLQAGEYLFRLGDAATHTYVVVEGRVDFCFPLSIGGTLRDVAVESKPPGSTLGWSAFVSPHSFTLSARAAEPSAVAAFPRERLGQLIEEDCMLGKALMKRVAEIVGCRLLKIQALWARELQRSVSGGEARPGGRPDANRTPTAGGGAS